MQHHFIYRLFQFIVAVAVLIAFAGGLSLFWWRTAGHPQWLFTLIEPLVTGGLFNMHQLIGLVAGSGALIGCLFLLILLHRSLPGILLAVSVAGAILSGLVLQVDTFTSGITVVVHRFSAWGTAPLCIWWLIVGFRARANPLPPVTRARLYGWSGASLLVVLILTLPGLYWLTTPDILHARYYEWQPVRVDGAGYDRAWRAAGYVELPAHGGSLFPHGTTSLKIWAVRHAFDLYLLVRWGDDNPSTNRWLEKTDDGWIELQTESKGLFGERIWWEDNMAISISRTPGGCASTCHLTPDRDRPGYHATERDTVDTWRWYAIRSTPVARMEDGWWGPSHDAERSMHVDNRPGGGYTSNLNADWKQPYLVPSRPWRRPWIDVESPLVSPYFHESVSLPIGHRVPAVIVAPSSGDATDVEVRARWENGFWTVEMRRRISTNSPFDVSFTSRDTVYLSIALFNNAEKHHAMVFRSIQLVVDPLPKD